MPTVGPADIKVEAQSSSPPLVGRLEATHDARVAAIGSTRPKREARTYDRHAWAANLLTLHDRALSELVVPTSLVGIVSIAWTVITQESSVGEDLCEDISQFDHSYFALILTALSFMLVFHLNRAATRHYEARQLCGLMMVHCRDLAMSATAFLPAAPRDGLCEVAVGFPILFMMHLHGPAAFSAERFAACLDGVFDEPTMQMLLAAAHRPLALILLAQQRLDAHWASGGAADTPLRAVVADRLLRSIQGLGQPLGGCERIQGTPIPFVVVAHLRTFLLLVVCAIPVAYGCDWGWATPPLSLLIAFALLGIEAAPCRR